MSNCNFRHFATAEMTEDWERGKRDGERHDRARETDV
jgi:hypothetical protein